MKTFYKIVFMYNMALTAIGLADHSIDLITFCYRSLPSMITDAFIYRRYGAMQAFLWLVTFIKLRIFIVRSLSICGWKYGVKLSIQTLFNLQKGKDIMTFLVSAWKNGV